MQEPSTSSEFEAVDIEDVVRKYSQYLSAFKFEKALEYMEEVRKSPLNDTWQTVFVVLSQLTSAESQYFALSLFSSKFSFRKEIQLKDTYSHINLKLTSFLDECELEPKTTTNMDFVLVFLRQFIAVVSIRIKLIEFYSFLSASSWRTFGEEALNRLALISEVLDKVFKNVIRFPQFSNMCTEISILQKLFKAQEDLLEVPMIDTILQIKVLQAELSEWLGTANFLHDDLNRRSFFSFSFSSKGKATSKFALLYWIHAFQGFIIAKVNLYYYLTISNYLPSGDFRSILLNSQPSFLQLFHTFMRRSNAQLSALILNRMDSTEPFFDFSYHKFLKKYAPTYCKPPITGIKGHFPPLVYFPQEKVFEKYHAPITSLIQNICLRGNEQNDKIKYMHDVKTDETCFIALVEKKVYLAVVFNRKIAEKDPSVQSFFNDILLCLRGNNLIHELKSGFK